MSHPTKPGMWFDRWWPLLVILFGVIFIATLAFFHPTH